MDMPTNRSADFSLPSQRLLGKVALVTGGATGIGESIVRLFHRHGAKVCVVDIQDDLGRHLCQTLDDETCFFHCDVSVEDDVRRAVDFTVDKFGTLDIMVNNAGVAPPSCDIRDVDLSQFEKVFDVNVKGTFHGMKHAARIMIPLKKGSIVSLASAASAVGGLAPHAYTGSKYAVVGLTKNVSAELGIHGMSNARATQNWDSKSRLADMACRDWLLPLARTHVYKGSTNDNTPRKRESQF